MITKFKHFSSLSVTDSITIDFVIKMCKMNELLLKISIPVNPAVYLKNPETSDLGRKIIGRSIDLIEKMGFEAFTFGKLSKAINSPEASVYRYFESKHMLLLYLTSWYW